MGGSDSVTSVENTRHENNNSPGLIGRPAATGVGDDTIGVENTRHEDSNSLGLIGCSAAVDTVDDALARAKDADTFRVLFSYTKEGRAVFLSHLAIIEIVSNAFARSGLPIVWTGGFNPLPKIDFASPLSVGIAGKNEIALTNFTRSINTEEFLSRMDGNLPSGLAVTAAYSFTVPSGAKKHSTPALLAGFIYENAAGTDYVTCAEDKNYRLSRFPDNNFFGLIRKSVLAKDPTNAALPGISYFDIYKKLYPF
jgi:hypothetical protein